MRKLILNTNFKLRESELQAFPRKNFAAVCFFDFFWKGKKVMSFPMQSNLFPWATRAYDKEYIEERMALRREGAHFNHLFIKENYLFSFAFEIFKHVLLVKEKQFWFWFRHFFNEEFLIRPHSENYAFKRFGEGDHMLYLYFEKVIKTQVFDFMVSHNNNTVLYNLMNFIGELEDVIETEDETIEIIGKSNINFYKYFPEKKTIDLDEYFSEFEILKLLDKVNKLGLDKNPFQEGIETSIVEYKEFLLSLVGPGKWEYTNLDINKLDLSIEELVSLFCLIKTLENPFTDDEDYIFSPDKRNIQNMSFPFHYFWYKLKEVVSK